ncbi:class I SAM-dependent methyltransferase [Rhodobacteraceae bacterium W635]|uniref:class I SAM-dependent methyltransferase n=1 Tax=Nioella halotolerans TaxID=2303578 RepID=UPI000E3C9C35|nr:class I SAM-dependent methyltransferase [Rhodobacteraceae bacterium W635]
MTSVQEQYDAFPYPERDPEEERTRLITGSPSHPVEIDHFLFAGKRDWSQPFRALVAGGGTGDALIQMAQVLTTARKPYEITYLDLSASAREVAEARAKVRGLKDIRFETGSLMNAAQYGPFDYIDCCGVLHHLPHPQEGFNALAGALKPGGGIGLMVYAPYGRSGVYPLQEAFATLLQGEPKDRLKAARAILDRLPEGHPFKRNEGLVDHEQGDAGFYDLLLHSQDRPYTIRELHETLGAAGLAVTGSPHAYAYDPKPYLPDAGLLYGLDDLARMEVAEKLRGTIKTHVLYAAPSGQSEGRVAAPAPGLVPHFKGGNAARMAQAIARKGVLPLNLNGEKAEIPVSGAVVSLLRHVDGKTTLAEIAAAERLDPVGFAALWNGFSKDLARYGLLYYSSILR